MSCLLIPEIYLFGKEFNMHLNRISKKIFIVTVMLALSAAMAFASISMSVGVTSDTARNGFFRSVGLGGELGFSAGGDLRVYATTALGTHSQSALYTDENGIWQRVASISDGTRIYFARTAAGIEGRISRGGLTLGLTAGAYLADRWFCLDGYSDGEWGRQCLYTFGASAGALLEKKLKTADAWTFVRMDFNTDLWTWGQLQERRGGRRSDSDWTLKGTGGFGMNITVGAKAYL